MHAIHVGCAIQQTGNLPSVVGAWQEGLKRVLSAGGLYAAATASGALKNARAIAARYRSPDAQSHGVQNVRNDTWRLELGAVLVCL